MHGTRKKNPHKFESNGAVGKSGKALNEESAGVAKSTWNSLISRRSVPPNSAPSTNRKKMFGVPGGGGGPSRSLGSMNVPKPKKPITEAGFPLSIFVRSKAQACPVG